MSSQFAWAVMIAIALMAAGCAPAPAALPAPTIAPATATTESAPAVAPTAQPATAEPTAAPITATPTTAAATATALPAVCEPTPPDMLGPFYVPGAPVRGRVGDGYVLSGAVRSTQGCAPIGGAMVELWMAGPDGAYADAYRATQYAAQDGGYRFESHAPPPYSGRPPHIHLRVSAPGYATLVTQHYPEAGQTAATFDLTLIPEPGNAQAGLAPVESVEAQVLDAAPLAVLVIARGNLPDGCTSIDETSWEQDGMTFRVAITTYRPADAMCTQALVPFEETVMIETSEPAAPGVYTVDVNGVTTQFEVAAQ